MPYRTHRFLLPDLMLGKDFLKIITIRFISFANSCFTSLNAKISFIAHVVCMSPLHSFCNNLLAYNTFALSNPLCQDHTALSNVLCELLFVRNSCFNISIFVEVILMILLRIFVAIEIVAYCGRVNLILYELWALFVGFSDGLCFHLRILCYVYNAFRCYCCVLLSSYKGRNKGIIIIIIMLHCYIEGYIMML